MVSIGVSDFLLFTIIMLYMVQGSTRQCLFNDGTCYVAASPFGTEWFTSVATITKLIIPLHATEAIALFSWVTSYTPLVSVGHSLFATRPVTCVLHQNKLFNVFYNVLTL